MSFHAAERLSPAMERLYLIITMICITVVSKKYNDYYIIPKKFNFRNEMTHTFMKLFNQLQFRTSIYFRPLSLQKNLKLKSEDFKKIGWYILTSSVLLT